MRPSRLRLPTLLLIVFASTLLVACDEDVLGTGERGSGNLVTESRDVADFDSIDVGSALDLDVIVDPNAAQSVNVTFDDNIIAMVVTRVSGNTLVLDIDGSVNLTGGADRMIAVTMKQLVALDASGASNVRVTGSATALSLDTSGASSVDLRDLTVTDVELDVSGASSVEVAAGGVVSGSVSGASSLDVYGDPSSVEVDSSGASSIDIRN